MSEISTMHAIEVFSGELRLTQRNIPILNSHQVLIKVKAAGINRPDIMQRKGLYPPPNTASDILGLEIAGIIIAIGSGVKHLKIDDAVCALVTGGGYAEYCLATATLCLPIPKDYNFIAAAALPETFFTVWSNVFDRAQLRPNETLFLQGGTSGIGTTAIQLATAFGAKIIVTAGSDTKCQACLDLGADAAINYKTQDFVSELKHITADKGVDVILDIIGGDYFPRHLQCLAFDGRLVQIAIQNGPKTELNLLPIMLKRLTITGSTLRTRDDYFKTNIAKSLLEHVWPLLNNAQIKPIIDSTFKLKDANQAHQRMESSQHIGKIILEV